jgi:hypothetical protein
MEFSCSPPVTVKLRGTYGKRQLCVKPIVAQTFNSRDTASERAKADALVFRVIYAGSIIHNRETLRFQGGVISKPSAITRLTG